MTENDAIKLLFIINPNSGNSSINWTAEIENYFANSVHRIAFYHLTKDCNIDLVKEKIKSFSPQKVVAVGGDGTVKLVAECILNSKMQLGILPAGSANGFAKEFDISHEPTNALRVILEGVPQKIHAVNVNGQICIHLSDIGLNAYVVKEFENQPIRGKWGYLLATLKVLWQNPFMFVKINFAGKVVKVKAGMIVIANATKYGSGAIINPIGRLDDKLFEVIVMKKLSIREIFKMMYSHEKYDSEKMEVFQTNVLFMHSFRKVHFQIDGEYLGKVKQVKAVIMPECLEVMVPNKYVNNINN
jgi:YegS/Rv2252/BmrU family lipid kinase